MKREKRAGSLEFVIPHYTVIDTDACIGFASSGYGRQWTHRNHGSFCLLLSELMAIRNPRRNSLFAGCPVPFPLFSGGSCQPHVLPFLHITSPHLLPTFVCTVSQSTAGTLEQLSSSVPTYL